MRWLNNNVPLQPISAGLHIHVNFGVRANTDEVAAHGLDRYRHHQPKNGGLSPPFGCWLLLSGSAQQLQHALLRLVGEGERGDRDRLADPQRLAVARFLVGVGQLRFEAPVCSTLIRFFEKSWRIGMIDRFGPRFDASERSVVLTRPARIMVNNNLRARASPRSA
jgi:hypothetical protein